MGATVSPAEQAAYTFRQGDDWSWSASATTTRSYDDATLLVQIREGGQATSPLVASSTAVGDAHLIDVSGSTLGTGSITLAWEMDQTLTKQIAAGKTYVIEAECEIDGKLTTFLRHALWVLPQVAVEVV